MKSPLFKRVVLAGAAFATVAASFVASASAANATVITAGGSDTTLNVMDAILAQANAPVGDTWVNLNPFATSSVTVPGDTNCPTMNFQVAGTTEARATHEEIVTQPDEVVRCRGVENARRVDSLCERTSRTCFILETKLSVMIWRRGW